MRESKCVCMCVCVCVTVSPINTHPPSLPDGGRVRWRGGRERGREGDGECVRERESKCVCVCVCVSLYLLLLHTPPPSLSLSPVAHRLTNGVTTKYLQDFERTGEMGFLFPKCADEFQQMINLVLYDPSLFTFHYRMRQALVALQMNHYKNFKQSQ